RVPNDSGRRFPSRRAIMTRLTSSPTASRWWGVRRRGSCKSWPRRGNSMCRTVRLVILTIAALPLLACKNEPAATAHGIPEPVGMAWTAQGENWAQDKAKLQALGEQFDSSQALFDKLKTDAKGGKPLTWAQLAEPALDWSGVYTRSKGGL